MARRIRYGVILALVLLGNVVPVSAIYNDCDQYLFTQSTDGRYCTFCWNTGGWSDAQTHESYCAYSCSTSICRTA